MKKDLLKHGKYYRGNCRNANVARWNADNQTFYYWRYKFGNWFVEEIKHPDDEVRYDVFDALEEIFPDVEIEHLRKIKFETEKTN